MFFMHFKNVTNLLVISQGFLVGKRESILYLKHAKKIKLGVETNIDLQKVY